VSHPRKRKSPKSKEPQLLGFLGVGLDNTDGHRRLTRADHFLLVGGSAETHERMQDLAIRFNEGLKRGGKRLEETPVQEVIDLLRKAQE
jgi:hypothetical protein